MPLLDAGPSCALPSYVPPAEVTTWEEFLATASALVCIGALRDEELGSYRALGESWCHPGFAETYLRRAGVVGFPQFPAREVRACLERLERFVDVIGDGGRCLTLLTCAEPGMCCPQRAEAGEPCADDEVCLPWLVCDAGECRLRGRCEEDGCPYELEECVDGECRVLIPCSGSSCSPGTTCYEGECVPVRVGGDACRCASDCPRGNCVDGRCTGGRPLGCDCDFDDECPADVSRCVDGRCTARPMLGEPCRSGAPCFGSACVDGICSRIPMGGYGCADDGECIDGLVCIPTEITGRLGSVPLTACVAPTFEGSPCALGLFCEDGLHCRAGRCHAVTVGDLCESPSDCHPEANCVGGECAPLAADGEPCSADVWCSDELRCLGTCQPRLSQLGDPCSPGTCEPELYCEPTGRCAERRPTGAPCAESSCELGATCSAGACRRTAVEGESCSDAACAFGTACDGGVCRVAEAGESCAVRPCRRDARCIHGACWAPICR